MTGLIARVLAAIRIVCPSAGDLAAISIPIIWPAPGRLSTTNCCPSDSESFCASARAMISVPPPAAEGTMKRTGFEGYPVCAAAPAQTRVSRRKAAGRSRFALITAARFFSFRRRASIFRSRSGRGGPFHPGCSRSACRPTRRSAARFLGARRDRKSTRLNSSHSQISYAVFCLKKKKKKKNKVTITKKKKKKKEKKKKIKKK